ncbi:hypothetical protein PAP_03410 [Palaeococcus pacificus DY20341]|uniref:Uncharacterized protein n=1 Tax=Palaeococcus pacificus DY20341 TaxID=1343739 RepID=A0A075LT40_9EURY|nr:hypothetical protein [Palaeococcus pacificus]AIF69102.1 hypothetical protein PAP_03410 [Palaeococcus pacificus DY20341]
MVCVVIHEIVEILIGIGLLLGFFSRIVPILYKSPFALIIGIFFVIEPLADIFIGDLSNILEFLGALTILLMIEKFIGENTRKKFNYYSILLGVVIGLISILRGSLEYAHVGTLAIFAVVTLRIGQNVGLFGWSHREIFFTSSIFILLSTVAFLGRLYILSDFMYFSGVLLFFLVSVEVLAIKYF